jgi:dihydrofolate reductase
MPSEIVIVVARARNGTIGKDNSLPWHIPADLKRFKALTMGSAMVMGRRTFESLPGLLPGRREIAHDIEEALGIAGDSPLSVIGGAEIFAQFLPLATRIELTEVLADYVGETAMPDPRRSGAWLETHREEHPAEDSRPPFRFITLKRAPI